VLLLPSSLARTHTQTHTHTSAKATSIIQSLLCTTPPPPPNTHTYIHRHKTLTHAVGHVTLLSLHSLGPRCHLQAASQGNDRALFKSYSDMSTKLSRQIHLRGLLRFKQTAQAIPLDEVCVYVCAMCVCVLSSCKSVYWFV